MTLEASMICSFLLATILLLGSCSGEIPRTGREFRKLHPELRRSQNVGRNVEGLSRSAGLRVYPSRMGQRLRKLVHMRRHVVSSPFPRRKNSTERLQSKLTRNFLKASRRFIRRRKYSSGTTTTNSNFISRHNQRIINKCKNIKHGKCCKGWTKHALTGYCMPSCVKACVHGTCLNEYVCKCDAGFLGPLCNIDRNECAEKVCEQGCLNTYGSYRCVCSPGHRVRSDGSCEKIHPCDIKKCQYKCFLDGEIAKCVCPKGYKVARDGRSCEDLNECLEKDIKCGSRDQFTMCKNLPGSYICTCKKGYFYHRYYKKCHDINECLVDSHTCNVTVSKCVNTEGSFRCDCRENFTGHGKDCETVGGGLDRPCHEHARKTSQTHGSKCTCNVGYSGDGYVCYVL